MQWGLLLPQVYNPQLTGKMQPGKQNKTRKKLSKYFGMKSFILLYNNPFNCLDAYKLKIGCMDLLNLLYKKITIFYEATMHYLKISCLSSKNQKKMIMKRIQVLTLATITPSCSKLYTSQTTG